MPSVPSLRLRQGASTQRITLTANGRVFSDWTALQLDRDMADLAAGATLEFYDPARAAGAFGGSAYAAGKWLPLAAGQAAVLAIDGEDVLRGWIGAVKLRLAGAEMSASVTILDTAAHLVECAAAIPGQPHEFRNLTLTQFVQRICTPYGITVTAQADVGAAFPLLSIEPGETALAAIEKYARQRALLVTSDGVGGLVITTGGSAPAPAALRLGENLVELDWEDDWQNRHSDYYVRAQAKAAHTARLNSEYLPATAPQAAPPATTAERPAVVITGHANDPEVTLYRPIVHVAKTSDEGATAQQQAEWRARVARGKGQTHNATVLDWRAGAAQALWRPNQLALVDDPFSGVSETRLIGGLSYVYGPDGALTRLRLVRPGAYDLDPAVRSHARPRPGPVHLNTEYRTPGAATP